MDGQASREKGERRDVKNREEAITAAFSENGRTDHHPL